MSFYNVLHIHIKQNKSIYFNTYNILHDIKYIYMVLDLHLHVSCSTFICTTLVYSFVFARYVLICVCVYVQCCWVFAYFIFVIFLVKFDFYLSKFIFVGFFILFLWGFVCLYVYHCGCCWVYC